MTAATVAKIDPGKVGKDIYELITYSGGRSFKQRARKRTLELKPDNLYSPSEVAALLNGKSCCRLSALQGLPNSPSILRLS